MDKATFNKALELADDIDIIRQACSQANNALVHRLAELTHLMVNCVQEHGEKGYFIIIRDMKKFSKNGYDDCMDIINELGSEEIKYDLWCDTGCLWEGEDLTDEVVYPKYIELTRELIERMGYHLLLEYVDDDDRLVEYYIKAPKEKKEGISES